MGRNGTVRYSDTIPVCGRQLPNGRTDRGLAGKRSALPSEVPVHKEVGARLGGLVQKVYRADHLERDFLGHYIHSLATAAGRPFSGQQGIGRGLPLIRPNCQGTGHQFA
jgi:hypothetical protein